MQRHCQNLRKGQAMRDRNSLWASMFIFVRYMTTTPGLRRRTVASLANLPHDVVRTIYNKSGPDAKIRLHPLFAQMNNDDGTRLLKRLQILLQNIDHMGSVTMVLLPNPRPFVLLSNQPKITISKNINGQFMVRIVYGVLTRVFTGDLKRVLDLASNIVSRTKNGVSILTINTVARGTPITNTFRPPSYNYEAPNHPWRRNL